MRFFRRQRDRAGLPPSVIDAVPLRSGERILAHATDQHTEARIVATTYDLAAVLNDGQVIWRHPWRDVQAGVWEPNTRSMTMAWTESTRGLQWQLQDGDERFVQVFRERIEASVLIAVPLEQDDQVIGEAALRRDLASGTLVPQISYVRGVQRSDPEVTAYADRVLDSLKEQAGL